MSNCTFCGTGIETGTGKLFIKRDGTVLNFCSKKCKINMVDMGRVNRHVRWTKAFEEHRGGT